MSLLEEEIQTALRFLLEENRRKTFKKWIFRDKETCNADKMAEAGFIFTGNEKDRDSVCCFFCNKALDGWESTDDPWKEHLKHAPKCKFAKLQKSVDLITLDDFLALKYELTCNVVNSHMNKLVEIAKELANEFKSLSVRNNITI